MIKEKWRDVPLKFWKHAFQVSNLGKFRSKPKWRKHSTSDKWYWYKGRILTPSIHKKIGNQYLHITFKYKGKTKTFRAARLVALAFVPNPNNLPEVNHKDTNKLNNKADNLEWMTNKENIHHAIKYGLMPWQ